MHVVHVGWDVGGIYLIQFTQSVCAPSIVWVSFLMLTMRTEKGFFKKIFNVQHPNSRSLSTLWEGQREGCSFSRRQQRAPCRPRWTQCWRSRRESPRGPALCWTFHRPCSAEHRRKGSRNAQNETEKNGPCRFFMRGRVTKDRSFGWSSLLKALICRNDFLILTAPASLKWRT